MDRAKRLREEPAVAEDFMLKARIIMEDDPFKERAPSGENRAFRALFGCSPKVAHTLWQKLLSHRLLPQGGQMTHLLWTLIFLKVYPTEDAMKRLTRGADQKTTRKYTRQFLVAISALEPFLIRWENRKKGDIGNDCLVSVDGTDFRIHHAGRRFYSFKYKKSGLRYEVALCILTGEIVWINGPYEPGIWNDLAIFRNALMSELEEGERVEADDGYNGEAPRYVKCPKSMSRRADTEQMQAFVRRRQETVNLRFKQFAVMRQMFRHDIRDHGDCFRAVAMVTHLSICDDEPLFSVDYQDPYLNDFYYPTPDDDDDDDDDDGNSSEEEYEVLVV